ncbi:thymidylate synthase [Microcystis phage MaeS]|nr:thymidylate synthase [Microcystis phage MaeS]
MKQYHDFLRHIINNGIRKEDRTGTGTISAIVPPSMRFDLREGFPIDTTKEINFELIKHELKWFTNGDTNICYLVQNGVNIWNKDAYRFYKEQGGELPYKEYIEKIKNDEDFALVWGDLGPIYGYQWRRWGIEDWPHAVDQLQEIVNNINDIKEGNHKAARRLILSAWNAGDIGKMALPPCHVMVQFFVEEGRYLSCHLYQRSGDAFLGIPFNISSYSLLTHIIAKETGLIAKEFIHTVGDAHIYLNHEDQVYEQLLRTSYPQPQLAISKRIGNDLDGWMPEDYQLINYKHHPKIKGELSV